MTQEDRKLLLTDLSARLPYGVKVTWDGKHPLTVTPHIYCAISSEDNINNLPKLLLRPMSSMTEEEKRHISKMICLRTYDNGVVYDMTYPVYTPYYVMEDCLSYLRSIHVDYSGLIEKGLAIEAPKDMYKI